MPERTSVTQVVQLGVETTPGTAVAANRSLPSLKLTTGLDGGFTEVDANGFKFPTLEAPGKEWTTAKVDTTQPTYDEIIYLLMSIFQYTAPVQQGATTAYLWAHSPSSSAADTVKTFTVEQGSALRAHKFANGRVTEVTLKGDRDKVEVSGELIGQTFTDGITLTGAPTVIQQVPILPKEVSVYADDTGAGLGTTKLTRVLSWEFAMKNRWSPLWVVDAAVTSWVDANEVPIDCSLKLMVEADAAGMAFLTTMRAGATKFVRVEAVSAVLAGTAFPYKFRLDNAVQVAEPPKQIADQDGVYAIEFEFKNVHDSTWAKALNAEVTNKRTAF